MTFLEKLQNNRNALGLFFMLPAAVLLLLFLTYPLGLGVWLGFTDAKVGRDGQWIGLENYEYLWGDAVTRLALFNTLFYTFVASVLKFVPGPVAGAAAQSQHPLQDLLSRRHPAAVHRADGALGDRLLVDLSTAQFSIISWVLVKMGWIDTYIDFLGDPWNARLSTIVANVWRGVPVRRDHAARRPADDLAVLLRSLGDRRRDAVAAVPPHHAAAADADHRGRDDVLGAVHVHRLPADLRADARRPAERDAPDGDAVVPARHLRRRARRGRGDLRSRWCRSCWRRSCSATSGCSGAPGSREGSDK